MRWNVLCGTLALISSVAFAEVAAHGPMEVDFPDGWKVETPRPGMMVAQNPKDPQIFIAVSILDGVRERGFQKVTDEFLGLKKPQAKMPMPASDVVDGRVLIFDEATSDQAPRELFDLRLSLAQKRRKNGSPDAVLDLKREIWHQVRASIVGGVDDPRPQDP